MANQRTVEQLHNELRSLLGILNDDPFFDRLIGSATAEQHKKEMMEQAQKGEWDFTPWISSSDSPTFDYAVQLLLNASSEEQEQLSSLIQQYGFPQDVESLFEQVIEQGKWWAADALLCRLTRDDLETLASCCNELCTDEQLIGLLNSLSPENSPSLGNELIQLRPLSQLLIEWQLNNDGEVGISLDHALAGQHYSLLNWLMEMIKRKIPPQ